MVLKVIVIGTVLVLGGAVLVGYMVNHYLVTYGFVFFRATETHQRRVRLLCDTDHHALLEACREISKQVARRDLKKSYCRIRKNPDPETSYFPEVILDLDPKSIYIDQEGRVMVEMFGKLLHFGVDAYPEDY